MTPRTQTADAPTALKDQAERFLDEGQVAQALALFRGLKDNQSYEARHYCWQQYAIALTRVGQLPEALAELTKLEKEKEIQRPERAHFRAITLRLQAEIAIVQGQPAKAKGWLGEAQKIFELNFDDYQLGIVLQLEGLLIAQEDPSTALDKLSIGRRMVERYRVPTGMAVSEQRIITSPVVPAGISG